MGYVGGDLMMNGDEYYMHKALESTKRELSLEMAIIRLKRKRYKLPMLRLRLLNRLLKRSVIGAWMGAAFT